MILQALISRSKKFLLQEVKDFDPNYNDLNKNGISYNNHSQSQGQTEVEKEPDRTNDDDIDIKKMDYATYEKIIKNNIEFDNIIQNSKCDSELIQELVNCMLDVICTQGETVKIGNEIKSREMVKNVYLKLNSGDIEHIIDRYKSVHHKITHIHTYLKKMLYTIKQEEGYYYTNAVRTDGVIW